MARSSSDPHLDVRDFGAQGDGVTDDTVAIQAAIDAGAPGQAIVFPATGASAYYLISDTLHVTTPSQRWVSQPRDAYAASIRTDVDGLLMVSVKATGFVGESVNLVGKIDLNGGWANGAGCTATGFELFGDADGNVDSAIRGSTVQYCGTAIVMHGRNIEISQGTLISNCRNGIRHVGVASGYHTGPNADQNRGNIIRDSRLHNIGAGSDDAAVEFTAASKVLHCIIDGNHFDSGGYGAHIVIRGTDADPARGVSIVNNKHTECRNSAVALAHCQYPLVSDFMVTGYGAEDVYDAVTLEDCLYPEVSDFTVRMVGRHAIIGTGNDGVALSDGRIIQVGQAAGVRGDALNFDSTNTDLDVDHIRASAGSGYFVSGSPAGVSTMRDCSYSSFDLGGIDTDTMMNHSRGGLNSYVEGRYGRIEDTGYAQYALSAGADRVIASVKIGNNFGAFILDIEVAGRHAISGDAYFIGRRIIRNENGRPVIIAAGEDMTAGLSVEIAPTDPRAFSITVSCAADAEIGCRVRAGAAGGAKGLTSSDLSVVMGAQ